jgi:HEAT repeat protein
VSKKAYDEKLAALNPLKQAPREEAVVALRKALKDRNNFYVAKAAGLAADRALDELLPDLLAAFERFFDDPVRSDPQCWAKNAIAGALQALGHREAATYLRGLRHKQMEPVWGGEADAAGPLRSACALALIDCPLPSIAILRYLIPLLTDAERPVRVDVIRAIAHLGDPGSALLLRLKAEAGDQEPEVTGQCLTALLAVEAGADAVPFVESFLVHPDSDVQLEAACALAQSVDSGALEAVKRYWQGRYPSAEIRRAILLNLGASPQRDAAEFLRDVIRTLPDLAPTARQALAASRFAKDE